MLELFRFTPALHPQIFSTTPRIHPWGGEREEGRLPAAPRQHPGVPPLLGMSPLRELAENPPSVLKRNSLSLAVIRGQPGLRELLLSTVIAAKKVTTSSGNENKTKQNYHLSRQHTKQGHQATVQTQPPRTNKQRRLSGLKGEKNGTAVAPH